jgi:outer membrane biogenesis lipoprotein LolB
MKTIVLAIACLYITACATMTPRQKNVAVVVGSVLVTGAVIAKHGHHDERATIPTPPPRESAR